MRCYSDNEAGGQRSGRGAHNLTAEGSTPSPATTFRDGQREAEAASRRCYLANLSNIEPGKAVKMPSGAVYARKGQSLIRLNRRRGTKKERRRAREVAKAAEKLPIEQLQAELAGEGA